MEHWRKAVDGGKTEVLGEKHLPVALGTPYFHVLKTEMNLSSVARLIYRVFHDFRAELQEVIS